MLSVFFVQREGLPDNHGSTSRSQKKAAIGINPGHVKNHDQDKYSEQSSCKNEQVLCFQPLEFHGPSYAFIDVVSAHNISRLKEEGAQYGRGHNKENTGTEPACSGFAGIGITAAEFIIHLYPSN